MTPSRRWRSAAVLSIVIVVTVVVAILGVTTGPYDLSATQLWELLTSGGGSHQERFIILDQRLPRVVCAIAVGAALGLSGAIFQRISRNPLGSPDLIGFSTGAATGGLLTILTLASATAATIAIGTIIGGFVTALIVYLLSTASRSKGERLILVGIGIGAMLASVNDYLLTRADMDRAQAAAAWKFGSLNAITWTQVMPAVTVIAVLIPVSLLGRTPLQILDLGDDTAISLGLAVRFWRPALLFLGITLAAVSVAAVGPVSFIALAAPQIATRVLPELNTRLSPAPLVGAFLLGSADLLAGRLFSPTQIPVGLLTSALGGLYLVWTLSKPAASSPAH